MFERLAYYILSRRKFFSFLLVFIVAGFSGGILQITADFNLESFFRKNSHAIYQDYYKQWGRDDAGIFILVSGQESSLLTKPKLEKIAAIAEQLRANKDVKRVVALPDFIQIRPDEEGLILEPVLDTYPSTAKPSPQALEQWRQSLLNDPIIVPNILSQNGEFTTIVIELAGNTTDVKALGPKLKQLRQTLRDFEAQSSLRFSDSGMISLRADFFEAILKDQMQIIPIGLLLMLTLMFLVYRKIHGALIPFAAAMIPTTMIFGLMGYMGSPLDMVNNTLTTLLPAIALADAIHLLSRFYEEARKLAGPEQRLTKELRRVAIARSLKELGSACFLTSLTTAVGFGSLYLAEMSVLQSFGLYAAMGIALSYGTVLFIMPLLLCFTRGEAPGLGDETQQLSHQRLMKIAQFSIRRPKLVLVITGIITAFFLYYSSKVVVNNSLTNLLPTEHTVADANSIVNTQLGGIVSYEIDFQSDEEILKNPRFLQALQKTSQWLNSNPDIRTVISPASFISQSAKAFLGTESIPNDSNLISQFYLLLDGNEELEQFLDLDFTRARMSIRAQDRGANVFGEFEKEIKAHLDAQYASFPVNAQLTGAAVMAYRGVNNITHDLRRGLIGAFLIVALIIALKFKSIFMVLISILANGIPLIVGYGSLGLFNWHLEPTTGLIFTVGLGIAVDDTIHLLARFYEEQKRGHSFDDALCIATTQCGKAVSLTSLLLITALGMNMMSSFSYIRAVGASGAAIIFAAWLCDLYTLPALLKLSNKLLPSVNKARGSI